MMRNCSPAMMTTIMPPMSTSPPVPRSGCTMMSAVGRQMKPASASSEGRLGGSGRSCSHQAQVMGTASFMISEGWKRMKPRSSQRCAPLPM